MGRGMVAYVMRTAQCVKARSTKIALLYGLRITHYVSPTMKLCFSTLGCPAWTLQQMVECASANGIGGIDFRGLQDEIDVTKLPLFNEFIDETLAMLRSNGLQMPCLNTSVTLLAPAGRWNDMLAECQRTASLAERSGTRFFRIFGGAPAAELAYGEARALARRRLR